MMNEKEKKIKEQRAIEATKKGYMGGLGGKFGTIMKHLGQPITAHLDGSSGSLDVMGVTRTELPSPWFEEEEMYCQMPTLGNDVEEPGGYGWADKSMVRRQSATTTTIGLHFDGLSRGMHLEMKYGEENSDVNVHYKGYLVYKEVAGDLQAYFPLPEWEKMVEELYKVAKAKEDEFRKQEKKDRVEEATKIKESWLQKMRKSWGI